MADRLNQSLLDALAVVSLVVIGIDLIVTLGSWIGLNKHLRTLRDEIYERTDDTFSKLTDKFWDTSISSVVEKGYGLFIRAQNINVRLSPRELHFFKAFPKLRIVAYEDIVKRLRIKEKVITNSEKKEI